MSFKVSNDAKRQAFNRHIENLARRKEEKRKAWLAKIAEYRAKGWNEDADAVEACYREAYPND